MTKPTLAERIAAACSPEAWEASRLRYPDPADLARWEEPARVAKRSRIQAACERAILAAANNPRASRLVDLRGLLSSEELGLVDTRLVAHYR
jgi:hypothetical protein